jgi:hypothetical protein
MEEYFGEDQRRIQHTRDVLGYAEQIMAGEDIGEELRPVVTASAIFHDIGIPAAIRKYGSSAAPYQEEEGARVARELLESLDEDDELTERVVYIVGNHHTEERIDGLDFQLIWEADLLVNLENREELLQDPDELRRVIDANFETATGRQLAQRIYLGEEKA